ncbi:hypothetical protein LX36DRAFT_205537 [Colletotrichum falcatum]|nr:hypothetical protein LX36DRAFT_205537 [Colletotrichum falcatum]
MPLPWQSPAIHPLSQLGSVVDVQIHGPQSPSLYRWNHWIRTFFVFLSFFVKPLHREGVCPVNVKHHTKPNTPRPKLLASIHAPPPSSSSWSISGVGTSFCAVSQYTIRPAKQDIMSHVSYSIACCTLHTFVRQLVGLYKVASLGRSLHYVARSSYSTATLVRRLLRHLSRMLHPCLTVRLVPVLTAASLSPNYLTRYEYPPGLSHEEPLNEARSGIWYVEERARR